MEEHVADDCHKEVVAGIEFENIQFYPVDSDSVLFHEFKYYKHASLNKRRKVPCHKLTEIVFFIYLVLTLLATMERPDFFNLTISCLGLLALTFPEAIEKDTYATLAFLTVLTFFYDFFYLLKFGHKDEVEVQHELHTRVFMFFVYVSFIFRVIVIVILWKNAYDMNRIMIYEA